MYAQLGEIKFEALKGFSSMSDKKEAMYAEHTLIDGKPRLQRTGNALDEFSISVKFHIAFCNPEVEYDALNRYRDDGEILPLIYGTGYFEGTFVITSLERNVNDTDKDGAYTDIDVNIGLREFYEADKMKSAQKRALLNAFAVNPNRPTPTSVPVPPLTPDAMILMAMREANLAVNSINNEINRVKNLITAPVTLLLRGQAFAAEAVNTTAFLTKNALSIGTSLSRVTGLVTTFPQILVFSPDIQTSLNGVLTAKTNFDNSILAFLGLPTVATDLDAQYSLDIFNNTTNFNLLLVNAMKEFTKKCSPLIALKSSRKKL